MSRYRDEELWYESKWAPILWILLGIVVGLGIGALIVPVGARVDPNHANNQVAIKACVAKGGVPIFPYLVLVESDREVMMTECH